MHQHIRALYFIAATALLAACGKVDSQSGELRAQMTRGPRNQPQIRVVGAPTAQSLSTRDAHPADIILMEEDGYTAAKDRWMQMEMLRRLARGQLSEILGGRQRILIDDPATDTKIEEDGAYLRDLEVLSVGMEEAVRNSWEKIQSESREVTQFLEAYARGVNRYLAEMPTVKPQQVRQYQLLTRDPNYKIRAWEPRDSIAVSVGIAFSLSSSLQEKLRLGIIDFMFQMFENGPTVSDNFLDFRPIEDVFIMGQKYQPPPMASEPRGEVPRDARRLLHFLLGGVNFECKDRGFPMPACQNRTAIGSNNWVVSKNFTGTGKTMLLNDPHLGITDFFLEASLDSKSAGGTIRVRGVKPPGVPGILIGHNDDIGWGLTNLGADVDDVYFEKFKDDSHKNYASIKGGYPEVVQKIYPLPVRQWDGSIKQRDLTVGFVPGHGPIFSDHNPNLRSQIKKVEAKVKEHWALSYRWTGHPGTTELVALLGVNRAHNFDEFKGALQYFKTGAQNFVYADKKGNVGYYSHADFPVRPWVSPMNPPYGLIRSTKVSPLEWEEKFRAVVPERYQNDGFIVTANNDPFGHSKYEKLSHYDDYFGFGFTDSIRAYRIESLIKETKARSGVVTEADMQRIQTDKKDELGRHFVELLENPAVLDQLPADAKAVAELLVAWKKEGAMADRHLHAPIVFNEWLEKLMHTHFDWNRLELGEPLIELDKGIFKTAYEEAMSKLYISSPAIKTLYHKTKDALADPDPAVVKKTVELLAKSLVEADASVVSKGYKKATWGEVNRLTFKNMFEGLLPTLFNLSLQRGGSWETVDPAGPGFGATFRMMLTLEEDKPISAQIVMVGGNYGPENQDALAEELTLWRDGALRPMVQFQ